MVIPNIEKMRVDTAKIIADWGQSLTIKRYSQAKGSFGQDAGTWQIVQQSGQNTIDGVVNPTGGTLTAQVKGQQVTINYLVTLPYNADVEPADRIYLDASNFCVAEVADKHPDRIEVLAKD
ncbi:MAG: hypothetical protein ACETWC_03900 [Acidobacteriota bacterium]